MIHLKEYPSCQSCTNRHHSVFCNLSSEEMKEMDYKKNCTSYKKGQQIFHENTYPFGLYCISSGKIKIARTGDEGKEQIIRLAKAGDILGYRALLSGDKYSCYAEAIEDSSLCFIPKDEFLNLVNKNANVSIGLMKLLSEDLKVAQQKITDLAQKPVRERLAEALLVLKETYGFEGDDATLNVVLSREELANIIGTATETTIRLISEFKNDGIIELNGKKIKIIQIGKLTKIANIHD
ncbi:MAG: Crp/Fnr family transcriptional regulator [Chitinophagales bacterium]|nr:Crp/Fnr family transcriptional regulator [Chitinophagales bacterium]